MDGDVVEVLEDEESETAQEVMMVSLEDITCEKPSQGLHTSSL